MRNIVILIFVLTAVSCMSDPSEQKTQNSAQEVDSKQPVAKKLIVEIDLEMSAPEDIRLMAVNTFLNNGKYIDVYITQKINANETSKVVKFEMPENISPDHFVGISFGPNTVKEIKINSIYLSYGDLNYNIPSENILNFFKTNNFHFKSRCKNASSTTNTSKANNAKYFSS